MNNLAAYASSDDDEEEEDVDNGALTITADLHDDADDSVPGLKQRSLIRQSMPSPCLSSVKRQWSEPDEEEAELEPVVRRHDWELVEAPRPPAAKKPRRVGGRVQIGIPRLPSAESDSDDDDGDGGRKRRADADASPASSGGSKLLSLLPRPASERALPKRKGVLLPSALSRANTSAAGSNKPPPKKASSKAAGSDSDSADEDAAGDFFGLADKKGATELFGPAIGPQPPPPDYLRKTLPAVELSREADLSQLHPSQLYNLAAFPGAAGPSSSSADDRTGASYGQPANPMSDKAAHDLIYKLELRPFGVSRPLDADMPELLDVSVDRQLGPEVEANIMKNLSRNPGQRLPTKDEEDVLEYRPDKLAKQKHQITYLAHLAKQREEQLKEEWSKNKFSRHQTMQKYGFRK